MIRNIQAISEFHRFVLCEICRKTAFRYIVVRIIPQAVDFIRKPLIAHIARLYVIIECTFCEIIRQKIIFAENLYFDFRVGISRILQRYACEIIHAVHVVHPCIVACRLQPLSSGIIAEAHQTEIQHASDFGIYF